MPNGAMVKEFFKNMSRDRIIEGIGTLLAMTGALLVAHTVGYGWFFYLVANFFLIALFVRKKLWYVVTLTLVFIYSDLVGIYNYVIKDPTPKQEVFCSDIKRDNIASLFNTQRNGNEGSGFFVTIPASTIDRKASE